MPHTPDLFVDRLRDLLGMPSHLPREDDVPVLSEPDEDSPSPPPPTPADLLEQRLRRGGLHLQRFEAPAAAILAGIRAGRPVVTLGTNGAACVLTQRVAHWVCVEDERGAREWVDARGLAAMLELASAGTEHVWFAVDAPSALTVEMHPEHSPWQMVFDLVRADRGDLLAIAVYAMGVGVLSLVLPLTVQVLVTTVAFGTLVQPIVVLTAVLGCGLVFAAILQALEAYLSEVIQRRLFVRVVSELAERLPRVHVDAFEQRHGPEHMNRFFDIFVAQKAIASLAMGGIEAALAALIGLLLLAFYHPILLAFGVLIVAGVAVVLRVVGRGGTRTAVYESKAKYAIASWLEDMAAQRIALKLAGGAEFAQQRLDRLAAAWLGAREEHFRIVFRQFVATLGLQVVTSAALLGIGGWLVVQRELTIGQLVAAELVVSAVVVSLSKLGAKLETAYDLAASADKLHALLDQPVERDHGGNTARTEGAALLELRSLSSLGNQLEDVSLVLKPGQRLRVSGGERRTDELVDVIFGLRSPALGAVLLDGDDQRDISLKAWRRRVAVVDGAEVFPTSVGENVAAVGRTLPSQEIWRLLERVGLADRVSALPEGLQTMLTPAGTPLTRSDALRLTLARALAARPGLLVVDRALDVLPVGVGEALLHALGRDQSLVLITHSSAFDGHVDAHLTLEEDSP
jgi:ABC-type bacteriocin/lantibiotic exporter with double-glycine peptidase domain